MKRRDRARKLARAQQHQEFVKERGKAEAREGMGKPPLAPRTLRRRLLRAGRPQWRGRPWKKGSEEE